MIRALLVDLGNVLVRFDHGRTLKKLEEVTDVPAPALRPHVFGPLEREFDLGRLAPAEFFRAVERSAGLPRVPDEVWIPAWRDIFEPDSDALQALRRLRPDVRKVLVSNTNVLHWEGVLRVVDLGEVVDDFVLSFEVGAAKPEKALFDAALARAGVRPGEALFCDDQPAYVAAARAHGIEAFAVTAPGLFERGLARADLLEPL